MLTGGDCDMNSSHIYTDSCNEVLRQTMLNQELLFRKQVKELHRLYTIQKTLMNGVGWKDLRGYNSRKVGTQSTVGPFINQMSCEPLATGKTSSAISLVGSIQFGNNNCLQEDIVICSRLQQRPHDLQLLPSRYIDYVGADLLKKENIWDSPEKSVETKRYLCGDNISCPEEVKLSLSIGGGSIKNGVGKGNDKPTYFSSRPIIDLEESTEMASIEKHVLVLGCDAPITPEQKHDSRVPAQPSRNFRNSVVTNPSLMTDSFVNGNESCQERGSFSQGFCEYQGDLSCNMSTKGKMVSSYEPLDFDLNKVLVDESFSDTNDPTVAYPSTSNSSGVSDGLIGECNGGSCSTAVSATLKEATGPPSEVDVLTHNAAISLIHFSSQSPISSINRVRSNEIENEEKEQPQRSLDSYESIVLKLAESEMDDYCASSRPFEVEEMDKRDCGIKLTRGRRIKDFQKDILPGLSSLSGREIWEDVNIMERAIRSREYKKQRSKMANGVNWFTPVRSRRSKLNYVCRKYHS